MAAGVRCGDAGACLETEGLHRREPDESPKRRCYGAHIAALLKHPLTGTLSREKNNLPINSCAHFYSQ